MATEIARNMKIYTGAVAGTAISCVVDGALNIQREVFDTSCKDSGIYSTNEAGDVSWSISGTARFDYAATNGFEELFDQLILGTTINVIIGTGVTGTTRYYGNALVTKLDKTASGKNAPVDFSFEFTGTGQINKATVA